MQGEVSLKNTKKARVLSCLGLRDGRVNLGAKKSSGSKISKSSRHFSLRGEKFVVCYYDYFACK